MCVNPNQMLHSLCVSTRNKCFSLMCCPLYKLWVIELTGNLERMLTRKIKGAKLRFKFWLRIIVKIHHEKEKVDGQPAQIDDDEIIMAVAIPPTMHVSKPRTHEPSDNIRPGLLTQDPVKCHLEPSLTLSRIEIRICYLDNVWAGRF